MRVDLLHHYRRSEFQQRSELGSPAFFFVEAVKCRGGMPREFVASNRLEQDCGEKQCGDKPGVTLCAVELEINDGVSGVSKNGSQSNLIANGLELCCILSEEPWNVTGSD